MTNTDSKEDEEEEQDARDWEEHKEDEEEEEYMNSGFEEGDADGEEREEI